MRFTSYRQLETPPLPGHLQVPAGTDRIARVSRLHPPSLPWRRCSASAPAGRAPGILRHIPCKPSGPQLPLSSASPVLDRVAGDHLILPVRRVGPQYIRPSRFLPPENTWRYATASPHHRGGQAPSLPMAKGRFPAQFAGPVVDCGGKGTRGICLAEIGAVLKVPVTTIFDY